ncbi:ABC transporter ATP-binding protein [Oceanobacillus massiliensis]|uniref:ABC transporter ATP-binding protein n=1 Tax=Oceanobacillus massiliensis TaxID=1465765 RepID=UPI000289C2C0|nr:ABC transporter ATP-binding protein [Oceanobacillus massiliensis]
MSFLTLDHVSHHYFSKNGYTKAVNNITLSIKEGEFVALLGPSGCGKSTLLSIVAGIIRQTEGNVFLQGKKIDESEMEIGYMLQQDYLFPWKTILDNVLIGPKLNNKITKELKERAIDLLAEVGLSDVAEKYPNELSGGMRQRAALVRTLINNPKILLLDEPFSALDYQTKLNLEDLVANLLESYHKTAILVTHDIGEAIAMSDRIFMMDANPGSIAKIYEVPLELRDEEPFLVRRHPKYQLLFEKIWNELEARESGKKAVEIPNE